MNRFLNNKRTRIGLRKRIQQNEYSKTNTAKQEEDLT